MTNDLARAPQGQAHGDSHIGSEFVDVVLVKLLRVDRDVAEGIERLDGKLETFGDRFVMALPPVEPAVKATDACASPAVAVPIVGAAGAVGVGVMA